MDRFQRIPVRFIDPSLEVQGSLRVLHFQGGQEFERSKVISYLTNLKANQPHDRQKLLQAIMDDLLTARHLEEC